MARVHRSLLARLAAPLKIVVSLLLLVWLARGIDLDRMWALLEGVAPGLVLLAVLLLALQGCVLALRWRLVTASIGAPLPLPLALRALFVGLFFNQVLPTSFGGDALRMWQAYRLGSSGEKAVSGVLLERLGGVLGLVLMTAIGAVLLWEALGDPLLRWGLIAPLPASLVGLLAVALFPTLPTRWWQWRPLAVIPRLAADARRVLLRADPALLLLALSLVAHGLAVGAFFVLAVALGLDLELLVAFAIVPAVILITMLPISFAAWGLREGAAVMLFGHLGFAADAALATSILFGLALLAASLPGLPLWLSSSGWARGGARMAPPPFDGELAKDP